MPASQPPSLPVPQPTHRIAFALGGLAGANGFGAGVLTAARAAGVEPDLISCTSGMIHWTWRYLENADLRQELAAAIAHQKQPDPKPASLWSLMTSGVEGVFRTATTEYWSRFLTSPPPVTANDWLERLMPAQMWVPTRSDDLFEAMASCFNSWDRPLFLNSYAPRRGVELVHMNPAGYDLWRAYGNPAFCDGDGDTATPPRRRTSATGGVLPATLPRTITAGAIRDALWLTRYGFESQKRIDGAYVRQFLLNELIAADTILVARPRRFDWQGNLPRTSLDIEDLETKLWFDSSYMQQIHHIDFINRGVASGALRSALYHPVDVLPVEVQSERGFFDYFNETIELFDEGKREATRVIHSHVLPRLEDSNVVPIRWAKAA
ncbi:MAG: hypothetical protein SF002_18990 [Alphaproteobacteria bacterium]|nr:hypothetical protein [Alphaproteobacteria bacterium]